jgi:hypothetical protein
MRSGGRWQPHYHDRAEAKVIHTVSTIKRARSKSGPFCFWHSKMLRCGPLQPLGLHGFLHHRSCRDALPIDFHVRPFRDVNADRRTVQPVGDHKQICIGNAEFLAMQILVSGQMFFQKRIAFGKALPGDGFVFLRRVVLEQRREGLVDFRGNEIQPFLDRRQAPSLNWDIDRRCIEGSLGFRSDACHRPVPAPEHSLSD